MLEEAGFQNIGFQLLSKEGPGVLIGIRRKGKRDFNKLVRGCLINYEV